MLPPNALESATLALAKENYARAEEQLREILVERPEDSEVLGFLGLACRAQDKSDEAAQFLERAARLRPNCETLSNFAASLTMLGRFEEAILLYRQALAFRPEYPEGHRNLGLCLSTVQRIAEAETEFRTALQLKPDFVEALNNLWALLTREDRHAESLEISARMLEFRPNDPDVWNAHGIDLHFSGRSLEAVEAYSRALRLNSSHANARFNLGSVQLGLGDLKNGWINYSARWEAHQSKPPAVRVPEWDGSDLNGKTILLWAEQGLGDSIQFIRYATVLSARGAKVVFRCPKPLVHLLARTPGIDRIVPENQPSGPADVHASVVNLPRLLGIHAVKDIAPQPPYITPAPELVSRWGDRLKLYRSLRVGVCCGAKHTQPGNRDRSFPSEFFGHLARVAGVHLFSLQKGHAAAISEVISFPGLDEEPGPFMDTAAIMCNLDLVVSCDTSIGHLAGALGLPVWLAINFNADWRWIQGRDDTPWYPRTRLFRQEKPGDWDGVFRRIATELRPLAARKLVPVEISPGEFFDRLAILELKHARIADAEKKELIQAELEGLRPTELRLAPLAAELSRHIADLRSVNEELWEIEDHLRDCERRQDFGDAFIQAARSVYRLNDRRASLKREINRLLGSRSGEAKSHTTC